MLLSAILATYSILIALQKYFLRIVLHSKLWLLIRHDPRDLLHVMQPSIEHPERMLSFILIIKFYSEIDFQENQRVNWKFNDHSSGFYGRYFGQRAPKAVGSIALRFSNEERFTMRFNMINI